MIEKKAGAGELPALKATYHDGNDFSGDCDCGSSPYVTRSLVLAGLIAYPVRWHACVYSSILIPPFRFSMSSNGKNDSTGTFPNPSRE